MNIATQIPDALKSQPTGAEPGYCPNTGAWLPIAEYATRMHRQVSMGLLIVQWPCTRCVPEGEIEYHCCWERIER